MSSLPLAAPWSVFYADGSANAYRFEQPAPDADVRFTYSPVTPERSSTGRYSGGAPHDESLAPGDPRVAELLGLIAGLAADLAGHTELRGKGTGAFTVTSGSTTQTFIVERGPALATLDAALARLRGVDAGPV